MLADLILTIWNQIAKAPNLSPRLIFRLYTVHYIHTFCYIMCSEIVGDVQPEQSDEPVDENEDLVNDGVHLLDEDLDEDA